MLAGADERLLDTYEGERRPIAAGVLGLSTKKYEGLGKLDPSSIKGGKDEKQLTLTYHGGPLAPMSSDTSGRLRVGDRAPDADLRTSDGAPIRLFDALRGPHCTAVAYGAGAAEALDRLVWPNRGARLRRIVVDMAAGEFRRTYGVTGDTLFLIRPDGYIGHIATLDHLVSIQQAAVALTPPTGSDSYAGGSRDWATRSSSRVNSRCSSAVRQPKISPATTT